MTRRWALITTIVVLAVALGFVVVRLVSGQGSDKAQADKKPGSSSSSGSGAETLDGLGWWPLHGSGTAKAGEHDASVHGSGQWTQGPDGAALRLNGSGDYADTGTPLDTVHKDYSVAARVRIAGPAGLKGMHTVLSQDGKRASAFFLQYSGPDRNFAFSFPGARTVAHTSAPPQPGRWYQLTGTYSQQEHRMRIYVDGRLAGTRVASSDVKPSGGVIIGRGRFGGKASDYWGGAISDVHIYDRELTSREVSTLSSHEPG